VKKKHSKMHRNIQTQKNVQSNLKEQYIFNSSNRKQNI
jgi:hypothetical protein